MQTEMGRIAGLLRDTPQPDTLLQKELDRVGKRLGLIVVIIAVMMFTQGAPATCATRKRWRSPR